ncbi:MAG: four helix bundle protein [Candidatus Margulisiibacteriota bacterium]|nr:four helix bundle protein [Candidatus Margulisiibacteriota bacterium]
MTKKYDIKDRTYRFALEMVKFSRILLRNSEIRDIGRQIIRSGTSIGANVEEADGARSRKEFGNKTTIARNEAKETAYWLRLIINSKSLNNAANIEKAKMLLSECNELVKILSSIIEKVK